MNPKWYLFIASAIIFFSCKREFVSSSVNGSQRALASAQSSLDRTDASISLQEQQYTESISGEKQKDTITRKKTGKKTKNNSPETATTQEEPQQLNEKQEIEKDMDPRLSRGLWMAIFGGVATTLGIVFKDYAPTGLFVFAFGIIFVIGMVTLILYWANPKPKM